MGKRYIYSASADPKKKYPPKKLFSHVHSVQFASRYNMVVFKLGLYLAKEFLQQRETSKMCAAIKKAPFGCSQISLFLSGEICYFHNDAA